MFKPDLSAKIRVVRHARIARNNAKTPPGGRVSVGGVSHFGFLSSVPLQHFTLVA